VIDDRFRIVDHLGSGGMATVFRAQHVRSAQTFAIKILHRELSSHPEMSARFQREVLAARTVQHPNVVSAMDYGRLDDGSLYLVLEYIQGEDLVTRLHRSGPLPQPIAIKIALQVADALVVAHGAGVVHRDLKPDNIMLIQRDGDSEFVKVVDFGIAKLALPGGGGQALTALGSVFGTPEYMAPEQARGAVVDHRADLYTLGIVLYEMLLGRTPFAADDPTEILIAQITKAAPPLPDWVDRELAELMQQLLAKDAEQRVQTAAEVAHRLRAIVTRLAPGMPLPMSASFVAAAAPVSFAAPAVPAAAPANVSQVVAVAPAISVTGAQPERQAAPLREPAMTPGAAPMPMNAGPTPAAPVRHEAVAPTLMMTPGSAPPGYAAALAARTAGNAAGSPAPAAQRSGGKALLLVLLAAAVFAVLALVLLAVAF
jgi:serine/threonine-protein kinase